MEKRLYRSRTDRILWGVCGGLAKYFDIDPIIIRIIFVLTVLAGGAGILAYIILAIVVPLEGSEAATAEQTVKENVAEIKDTANQMGQEIRATLGGTKTETTGSGARGSRLTTLGAIIVALGILLLLANLNIFWWFKWQYFWPVIIILAGLLIIMRSRK